MILIYTVYVFCGTEIIEIKDFDDFYDAFDYKEEWNEEEKINDGYGATLIYGRYTNV